MKPHGKCGEVTPKQQIKPPYMTFSRDQSVTFLTLPVEIRLQIYEYVLIDDQIFWIDPPSQKYLARPLLKTCKQIYEEATLKFYGKQKFGLHITEYCLKWLYAIGIQNIRLLHNLDIIANPHPCNDQKLWVVLFRFFADEATSLENISIAWIYDRDGLFFAFWCDLSRQGNKRSMEQIAVKDKWGDDNWTHLLESGWCQVLKEEINNRESDKASMFN